MDRMTAKEALREYVDGLTEDDAAELLLWIEDNVAQPPLTQEQIERVRRSIRQLDEGQRIPRGTIEKQFGAGG